MKMEKISDQVIKAGTTLRKGKKATVTRCLVEYK